VSSERWVSELLCYWMAALLLLLLLPAAAAVNDAGCCGCL